MSSRTVNRNTETDILSIMREIESKQIRPQVKEETKSAAPPADPTKLLESLQKKRELINLIGGYADIGDMKSKLNEAIADLEEIIGTAV